MLAETPSGKGYPIEQALDSEKQTRPGATESGSRIRVLKPTRSWFQLRLRELWEQRELIWILAWRDVAVRYKQTIVGAAWAIAQPAVMVLIFSIVFRRWAHMPSQGVSYPLFAFVGLLPWQYFSNAMTGSSASLLKSSHILTKVYFPRLVIPTAAVLPPLIDLAFAFFALTTMLFTYGVAPSWRWLLLPALVLLTMLLSLAVGIWISALSVEYRDISHLVPFVTQLWMFASPIVYPPDLVGERWRLLYSLNPMTGIIDGFRWAILATPGAFDWNVSLSVAIIMFLLLTGIIYFQHVEKTFADLI